MEWYQMTWGALWRRIQRWEGHRAPIDVMTLEYKLIGARHGDCPKVHRSYDSHVACMQERCRRDYEEMIHLWDDPDPIKRRDRLTVFDKAAAESRARIGKLRFF